MLETTTQSTAPQLQPKGQNLTSSQSRCVLHRELQRRRKAVSINNEHSTFIFNIFPLVELLNFDGGHILVERISNFWDSIFFQQNGAVRTSLLVALNNLRKRVRINIKLNFNFNQSHVGEQIMERKKANKELPTKFSNQAFIGA